jgi:hypothetical protein
VIAQTHPFKCCVTYLLTILVCVMVFSQQRRMYVVELVHRVCWYKNRFRNDNHNVRCTYMVAISRAVSRVLERGSCTGPVVLTAENL